MSKDSTYPTSDENTPVAEGSGNAPGEPVTDEQILAEAQEADAEKARTDLEFALDQATAEQEADEAAREAREDLERPSPDTVPLEGVDSGPSIDFDISPVPDVIDTRDPVANRVSRDNIVAPVTVPGPAQDRVTELEAQVQAQADILDDQSHEIAVLEQQLYNANQEIIELKNTYEPEDPSPQE